MRRLPFLSQTLAIGAGGLEVAMPMAGELLFLTMPRTMGVRLTGELPDWVSAKDVILSIDQFRNRKGT